MVTEISIHDTQGAEIVVHASHRAKWIDIQIHGKDGTQITVSLFFENDRQFAIACEALNARARK